MADRWVAFLRSINVGGRRVTNDELQAVISKAGFDNVSTFLASGNLIFDSDIADPVALEDELGSVLENALEFEVPVFVRSNAQVVALAAATPFSNAQLAAATSKPQVTLLAEEPSTAAWKAAQKLSTDDDVIVPGDRCWFWLPKSGIAESKLNMRQIEGHVGVGTTRTLNTVQRITKKFLSTG